MEPTEIKNSETPDIKERSKNFLRDLFTLDDINFSQSTSDIKAGVAFKGFNIWILICSILICSLGLNMDSTAVVIGAMLISPLMGPIVGLGLGIGIFDRKLIFKALKNLSIATVISILTAYLFFKLTPTEEVHELLSRTKPTILDLLVAFFGGIAGILAAARCQETNAIPGVAIATALMPPLCTAGYGLAIGNMDYAFGAFYLFIMNCIMISLAALLVVLYLRYPKFSFVNNEQKKKVRAGIALVVILVSIPSIYFYYNLLQENSYKDRIEEFVQKEIESQTGTYLNNYEIIQSDNGDVLNVNISGTYLESDSIESLKSRMMNYKLDAKLNIIQPQPIGFKEQRLASLKTDIIKELYQNSSQNLKTKDDEIALLKNEVQKLSGRYQVSNQIIKLAQSQFDLDQLAVDVIIYTNDELKDTIPTAIVDWNNKLTKKEKVRQTDKLQALLKVQLNAKEIKVIEIK
jgi:uncharacterized hydrophobic protein (TIGR00271 family)